MATESGATSPPPEVSKDRLTRAAGSVSLATLISRILGFVRDMIIADLFGARAAADAFFVAFRIPNLLRRFTAEGALTAAFVPVYSETLERDGKPAAFALACNLLSLLTAFLVALTAAGMIWAPWVVAAIAPGFTYDPETYELTTQLTRLMFPFLPMVSITAVMMAMLNSMGRFFVPAIAPAALNVCIILCALAFSGRLDEPTMSLAIGVLAGGLAQMIIQLAPLIKMGWRFIPSFNVRDVATRNIGRLMVPAAMGMAVVEINVLVDTLLASLLPEGSVSYLYYGNRVVQFPLGVFGVAVGIAALPTMSAEAARGRTARITELVSHALRLTLFISVPSTIGLLVLSGPICNVLFERGEFDEAARIGSAYALAFYAVGLVAFSGVKAVVAAFYALKDTATPTRVASWCMALNVALNLALMGPLKHGGLALATSISSIVNLTALLWLLGGRLGSVEGGRILRSFLVMLASSVVMGAAVYGYAHVFFDYAAPTPLRAFHLCAAIAAGVCVYYAIMMALGSGEARTMYDRLKKRLGAGA